jgi:hypothetical protein
VCKASAFSHNTWPTRWGQVSYTFVHLFHISSALVRTEIQFGVGFLVVMTVLVLHDLDDPVRGVIRVPGIPEHWKQAPSVDAVRETDVASVS